MKENNELDPLKIIIEKFLSWDSDCKEWSFDYCLKPYDEKNTFVRITIPYLLDSDNKYIELFSKIYTCGCCDQYVFKITDLGFLAKKFQVLKKQSLFKNPLSFFCELKEFNEGMDYYFDAFRCAGIQVGFSKLLTEKDLKKIDEKLALINKKEFLQVPGDIPYLESSKTFPSQLGSAISFKKNNTDDGNIRNSNER